MVIGKSWYSEALHAAIRAQCLHASILPCLLGQGELAAIFEAIRIQRLHAPIPPYLLGQTEVAAILGVI